ncbi:uncharacterized protein LOC114330521 [Diabrotica virgifera virgifera]|uniref:Uncharacterized protein LOC114330521 n=1 Tax=Diabrotica virgifera virgifera TaxID=50390 RepID=A0A6P7FHT5_DIAVI|nr:uncharacterized protein LOC114330521 [Diabrotica virgifera virgifera]
MVTLKMLKIALIFVICACTAHIVSSAAVETSDNQLVLHQLRRLQRDLQARGSVDLSIDNIINTVISTVINVVSSILIKAFCGAITPYLLLVSVFRSTVIKALSLIVQFLGEVATSLLPALSDTVTQITSFISTVDSTIGNALDYVNKAGCSVSV